MDCSGGPNDRRERSRRELADEVKGQTVSTMLPATVEMRAALRRVQTAFVREGVKDAADDETTPSVSLDDFQRARR